MPAPRQEQFNQFNRARFDKAHEQLEPNRRIVISEGTIEIIPELNKEWADIMLGVLHYNQRNLDAAHLQRIKRALKEGKYEWLGDPIRIDTEDNLIDGQHRLMAVADSGISMYNVILVTVKHSEAIKFIDTTHKPRTTNDIRSIHGMSKVPKTVEGAILFEYFNFSKSKARAMSKPEIFEITSNSEFLEDALALFALSNKKKNPITVWAGPLSAAIRTIRVAKDPEVAKAFFKGAFTNHHYIDNEFVPQIQLLSSYYLSVKQESVDGRSKKTTGEGFMWESAYKSIRSWNAFRENRNLSKLQLGRESKMPKVRK